MAGQVCRQGLAGSVHVHIGWLSINCAAAALAAWLHSLPWHQQRSCRANSSAGVPSKHATAGGRTLGLIHTPSRLVPWAAPVPQTYRIWGSAAHMAVHNLPNRSAVGVRDRLPAAPPPPDPIVLDSTHPSAHPPNHPITPTRSKVCEEQVAPAVGGELRVGARHRQVLQRDVARGQAAHLW